MFKYNKNSTIRISYHAFTLAEVLITLGIIGIVAAMTLPAVINNIKNKEHEARFKTAYSQIFQAVQLMGNEDPQLWQTYCGKNSSSEVAQKRDKDFSFINKFSKQFQVLKVYPKNSSDLKNLGYKNSKFYGVEKGKNSFNDDGYNNGGFITKNGMIILSSGCWWVNSLDFVVDTNGIKGPNKFGYDVFYFQIDKKTNQLLPSTITSSFGSLASQEAGCCDFVSSSKCSIPSDNGSACSRFAIMDSFPGEEKSYWKNLPTP